MRESTRSIRQDCAVLLRSYHAPTCQHLGLLELSLRLTPADPGCLHRLAQDSEHPLACSTTWNLQPNPGQRVSPVEIQSGYTVEDRICGSGYIHQALGIEQGGGHGYSVRLQYLVQAEAVNPGSLPRTCSMR